MRIRHSLAASYGYCMKQKPAGAYMVWCSWKAVACQPLEALHEEELPYSFGELISLIRTLNLRSLLSVISIGPAAPMSFTFFLYCGASAYHGVFSPVCLSAVASGQYTLLPPTATGHIPLRPAWRSAFLISFVHQSACPATLY